jgi:hypothetical protein
VARHLFDTCSTRPTERAIEQTENQISLLKALLWKCESIGEFHFRRSEHCVTHSAKVIASEMTKAARTIKAPHRMVARLHQRQRGVRCVSLSSGHFG